MSALAQQQNPIIEVKNPYSQETIGEVVRAGSSAVAIAGQKIRSAAARMAALTQYQRSQILEKTALRVEQSVDDYATLIASEAGKPVAQARNEARRCVNTLKFSAHAALELHGETVPFDACPNGAGRSGYFTREPLGAILAITPFNDPLNLVAHKLGPAIAGGNSIILKPSERTPLCAERLMVDFLESGLPESGLTVLHGGGELVQKLLCLPFRMVSFTGGFAAAEEIVAVGGVKKYAMDLGGNAAVIVNSDADLTKSANACVAGAFGAAGQNCIGVQRILVHQDIAGSFEELFVKKTSSLVVGDPLDEGTEIGPMIGEAEAIRAETWTQEATTGGSVILNGNRREGALFWPTTLKKVPKESRVWRHEVFCPLVSITPFRDINAAIELANDSDVSLHAGIFTQDLEVALDASARLEASGVMINDSSDFRFDGMPFGGFKKGSMGREGVKFAVEEMTQTKTICMVR